MNKGPPGFSLEQLGWNPTWAARFEPHAQAGCFPGRICIEHKELYRFCSERGEGAAEVSGRLRHEAGRRSDFPAVGDWVALRQTADDHLAVIHAVLERNNRFSRKLSGKEIDEQIVVANLDTLFLVTSLNRDFNPRRIVRYLAALSATNVQPVLLLNKSDLCESPEETVEQARAAIPNVVVHAVSAQTGAGLEELVPYLATGQTVALAGSSGVGKSTLLNRLLGEARQEVREIRERDDRGRHTTTHREMIPLPQGGLLIDNPGMRELQLWDEGTDLDGTFTDVAALAQQCRFADCGHQHEPGCAVQRAIMDGALDAERFENYLKLQRELAYLEAQHDPVAERARKERERKFFRAHYKEQRRRKRR